MSADRFAVRAIGRATGGTNSAWSAPYVRVAVREHRLVRLRNRLHLTAREALGNHAIEIALRVF